MSDCLLSALIESLSARPGLGKSRLKTLILLPVGLIRDRTANLSRVAGQCRGPACYIPVCRRLLLPACASRSDVIAALVVHRLG